MCLPIYDLLVGNQECAVGGFLVGGAGIEGPADGAVGLVLGGSGAEESPAAGVALGGSGAEESPAAGVALGGSGYVFPVPLGLLLGGAGELPADPTALKIGGYGYLYPTPKGIALGVLTGIGSPPPGMTCETALFGEFGTTYSWTTNGTEEQWYSWRLTPSTLYHLSVTAANWTNLSILVWHGKKCSSLTGLVPPTSIDPCIEYTPGSREYLFVQIAGGLAGDTDYTVLVDTGACP